MAHVSPGVRAALARRRRLRALLWMSAIALMLALAVRLGSKQGSGAAQQQAAPKEPAKIAAAAAAGAAEKPAADTAAAAGAGEKPAAAAAAAADGGGSSSSGKQGTGIFFDVPSEKEGVPPTRVELLNEPVPEDCYMEEQADYDGAGMTWGLTYKKASAAQCCQACKEHQPEPDGKRCNVWVWCGSPTGECWSADIWNHTTGECWLKYQKDWDGSVDRAASNLAINRRGAFPPEFRAEHKTAPEAVQWTSGVIPARKP